VSNRKAKWAGLANNGGSGAGARRFTILPGEATLELMRKTEALEVEGREVTLSNLDKVMYPAAGFTKGQVIDYYVNASRFILPHLKNRPLTLKRYPEGVTGGHFYEKNAPRFTPPWIKRAQVERKNTEKNGGLINYVLINDLPSLVWAANLASLELHVFLAKAPQITRPTFMVFDLDPGPPADVLACGEVALTLRDALAGMGLKSWVKSSGSKGLQLYVPLNTATTYEKTQPLAKGLAESLERAQPDLVVAKMAKEVRGGKVFIDWSQNSEHKTTVCVYSLRAKREQPFVSFPIAWADLERALKKRDLEAFFVTADEAIKRLEKDGDQFREVLTVKQKLPAAKVIEKVLGNIKPVAPRSRLKGVGDRTIKAYKAKRDFSQTPEPDEKRASFGKRKNIFVIQKHAASRLHYDFRLGMDGVLKSWAVPKGPPYTRAERRLAMHVEDHPMSYKDFEGTIAPGNYGAGTVMVWDQGTYELMDGSMEQGKLHFRLHGKKLEGEWILVRGRKDDNSGEPWFLIKGGESMKPLSQKADDQSAVTGRTMEEIGDQNDRQWQSNRAVSQPRSRRLLRR
jgi:bifunctional non-homologous end joining protein LigD